MVNRKHVIGDCTSFASVGACSAGGIRVMKPFCTVKISLKDMLKYILPLKIFREQNGLVDPMEVPLTTHWPVLGDEN